MVGREYLALWTADESVPQLSELAQRSVFAGNKRLVQLLLLKEKKINLTICNTLPR